MNKIHQKTIMLYGNKNCLLYVQNNMEDYVLSVNETNTIDNSMELILTATNR